MWQSEEIKDLAVALGALQSELKPLKTNKENPFFKSSYADLEAVTQHLRPLLKKHGLSFTQFPSSKQSEPTLVTQIMHVSGQWIRAESKLYLVKQDQQSVGSATTYAKRQALQASFGIAVTDEDDDGNSSSVLELNKVRELYALSEKHCSVTSEFEFQNLLTEFYQTPTDRTKIPKADYSKLKTFITK